MRPRPSPAPVALLFAFWGCGSKDDDGPANDDTDSPTDPGQLDPSVWPTKRSEILAATHVASGRVMIFGGNDGPIVDQIPTGAFRKDTWVLDPRTGWTEIDAPGPSKRGRYTVSVDEAGGRALLFGGRFREAGGSGDYELYNDLWAYDFDAGTWEKLDAGKGTAPAPRYYPASAWDADAGLFYVLGGATNRSPLTIEPSFELWAWDGSAWSEVPTRGEEPSSRMFYGHAHDAGRGRLLLFGGNPGDFISGSFSDFYAMDLNGGAWSRLHDGSGTVPSPRMHAGLIVDDARDRYLLFGGHTDVGDMNDLWAYDPETDAWSEERIADVFDDLELGCLDNPSEVPADYVIQDLSAPERRHRGLVALLDDKLWIYGGMHAECSDHLDDTWYYDLAGGQWVEVIEATSGESCARRADACECLCI